MTAQQLAANLGRYLITPIILLVFAIALLLFVWGLVQFLIELNTGGKANKGKQHMLWGIIGMFIMTAAWGILNLIQSTVTTTLGGH